MKTETIARILLFSTERNLDQFHTPAKLEKSISIEVNKLLECFQWNDKDYYDLVSVKEELADMMVLCNNMLDTLGLDADAIISVKMDQNEVMYVIQKCRGSNRK